jgi:hypothetical protein
MNDKPGVIVSEFRPGVIVRLKSGGEQMTVARLTTIEGIENAVCGGHKGKRMEPRTIPTSMLEIVR